MDEIIKELLEERKKLISAISSNDNQYGTFNRDRESLLKALANNSELIKDSALNKL